MFESWESFFCMIAIAREVVLQGKASNSARPRKPNAAMF